MADGERLGVCLNSSPRPDSTAWFQLTAADHGYIVAQNYAIGNTAVRAKVTVAGYDGFR